MSHDFCTSTSRMSLALAGLGTPGTVSRLAELAGPGPSQRRPSRTHQGPRLTPAVAAPRRLLNGKSQERRKQPLSGCLAYPAWAYGLRTEWGSWRTARVAGPVVVSVRYGIGLIHWVTVGPQACDARAPRAVSIGDTEVHAA